MILHDLPSAPIRYLSLFSGIEAATVAWKPLGWICVGTAEIEKFPSSVIAHHYPDVPNLGDVTKITEAQIAALDHIDVMVFGSPCQDMSIAGKRKGLLNADGTITRSGLFFTAFNIFQWAKKHCSCRFALWENVPGAYSSNQGRDFASVVMFMAGLDDVSVPINGWGSEGCALGDNGLLEWSCLDAQWFGVAQRRRRVFAVLDTGDWTSRQPILLERQSLRGDTAPLRQTGQDVTGTLSSRTTGGGGFGTDFECTGGLQTVNFSPKISHCLNAGGMGRQDYETEAMIVQSVAAPVMRSVERPRGDGVDTLIAFSCKDHGADATPELAPTMRAMSHAGSHANADGQLAVAFVQNSRDEVRLMGGDGQIVGALAAEAGMKQQCYIAQCVTSDITHCLKAEGFDASEDGTGRGQPIVAAFQSSQSGLRLCETHATLDANNGPRRHNGALIGMAVRRLTPIECARLQGFPDDYLGSVIYRSKRPADGPMYKALGNSMAVPVMSWIGSQIQFSMEKK